MYTGTTPPPTPLLSSGSGREVGWVFIFISILPVGYYNVFVS